MTRTFTLALLATIAIATANRVGETVVPETVAPFEEFLQDPVDDKLTLKMNGAVVVADTEGIATDGPSDAHDAISCDAGEVLCLDGTCAIECPSVNPDAKPGFTYVFQPKPTTLAAPPNVAGREVDYQAMAANFHDSQISGEEQAIVNAEQSAGLGFASHDQALQENEQRLAARKQEVEKDMNLAAAQAAHFKEASKSHDAAALNVKKSQAEEKAQERVVEEARATLKAEEKKLREAKLYVSKMIQIEEDARYKAEYSGQLYEAAKAKAVGEDNALQEELHETAQKEHYRQVALKAVREAASKDLLRTKEEAITNMSKKTGVSTTTTTTTTTKPAAAASCSDCVALPELYQKAGGKCSDCPKWAEKGQCHQAEYSKFMSHYCAASCGCPKTEMVTPETTQLQMPTN